MLQLSKSLTDTVQHLMDFGFTRYIHEEWEYLQNGFFQVKISDDLIMVNALRGGLYDIPVTVIYLANNMRAVDIVGSLICLNVISGHRNKLLKGLAEHAQAA